MKIRSVLALSVAAGLLGAMPTYAAYKSSEASETIISAAKKKKTMKKTTPDSPGASEYAPGRNPGTASTNNPGRSNKLPPGQQMK
jgi:hypothetical protein